LFHPNELFERHQQPGLNGYQIIFNKKLSANNTPLLAMPWWGGGVLAQSYLRKNNPLTLLGHSVTLKSAGQI
jgi:hypothetical protein